MKNTLAIIIFSLASAPMPLKAVETSTYDTCIDQAGAVDAAMTDCVSAESERQDKRLNVAYSKLLEVVDPSRRGKLRDAQRAWLQYRDKSGAFLVNTNEGTLDRLMYAQDYLQMIRDRADELESILAHETQ